MSQFTIEVTVLSVLLCALYAAKIPYKITTESHYLKSESYTIAPVRCDVEMPDPNITILPWSGFCISVPDTCWQTQMIFFVSQNVPKDYDRPKYKEYVRKKDMYGQWTYCNYEIELSVDDTIYYSLGMIQDNGFTYRHVSNAFTLREGGKGESTLVAVKDLSTIPLIPSLKGWN